MHIHLYITRVGEIAILTLLYLAFVVHVTCWEGGFLGANFSDHYPDSILTAAMIYPRRGTCMIRKAAAKSFRFLRDKLTYMFNVVY